MVEPLRSRLERARARRERATDRSRPVDESDRIVDPVSDLDTYSAQPGAPSDQQAFDVFGGRWSSGVPGIDRTGITPLFADPRIEWMLDELGDVSGWDVLELGSLEGGHTWMLERRGAVVTAIEANRGAFLRSLVVKNQLDLRARFVLGDVTHPDADFGRRDLIVASGLLYHLVDPLDSLVRWSRATDRLYLWTHYFEPDLDRWDVERWWIEDGPWDLAHPVERELDGRRIRMIALRYPERRSTFSGGVENHAHWIFRDDLFVALETLGFDDVRVAMDEPAGSNGPSLCVLAQRRGRAAGDDEGA